LIISFFFFFSCCCYEFDKRRVAQLRTHPAQENGTQCFIHHTRPSVRLLISPDSVGDTSLN
jgi:hypothetical protein